MSDSAPLVPNPAPTNVGSRDGRVWDLPSRLALITAPLPFVLIHFRGLWSRDWYRFYPVLLAAVAILWLRSGAALTGAGAPRYGPRARFVMAVSVALLLMAVLLASPWLAAISFLLLVPAVVSRLLNQQAWQRWLAIWLLLLLLVPPPLGLDEYLVVRFERLVLHGAAMVLDYLGQLHWLTGKVLQTSQRQFLLEFAFLRYFSLFAAASLAACVAVWRQRGLVTGILSVLMAPCWLAVAEIASIVALPAIWTAWKFDLSRFPHSVLYSVAVVLVTALLIASADQLLRPLSEMVMAILPVLGAPLTSVGRFLRRRRHQLRSKLARETADPITRGLRSYTDVTNPGRFARLSMLLVSFGLFAAQFVVLAVHRPEPQSRATVVAANRQRLQLAFPASLTGWRSTANLPDGLSVDLRATPADRQWLYAASDARAVLAVHFDAGSNRDLIGHLQRQGWHVCQCREQSWWDPRGIQSLPQAETELVRTSGEAAFWQLLLVDERGVPRTPLALTMRARWVATPLYAMLVRAEILPELPPDSSFALHWAVLSRERLSAVERDRARAAFRELRRVLRDCWKTR
jgi:hypothetical protein